MLEVAGDLRRAPVKFELSAEHPMSPAMLLRRSQRTKRAPDNFVLVFTSYPLRTVNNKLILLDHSFDLREKKV